MTTIDKTVEVSFTDLENNLIQALANYLRVEKDAFIRFLVLEQINGLLDEERINAASILGKLGADVKHERNRAAKAKAIEIYNSKSWPSLAQAARTIGPQVSITEFVVLKWLRKHRQDISKPAGAAS